MLLPRLSPPPAVLVARVSAAAALLLFFLAAAAIVVAGSHKRPLPHDDARFIGTRLVAFDESVRTQLARLGPAGSITDARRRTREVVAQINALSRAVGTAGGASAARLRTAIGDELRFLDARRLRAPEPRELAAGEAGHARRRGATVACRPGRSGAQAHGRCEVAAAPVGAAGAARGAAS